MFKKQNTTQKHGQRHALFVAKSSREILLTGKLHEILHRNQFDVIKRLSILRTIKITYI